MLRPQAFLFAVRERAAARLPVELQPRHTRVVYATLQMHYGNPRIHYEVWLVRKTGRIEVGLHFEDERGRNHQLAQLLAAHADILRASIGAAVELEEWTASWARLHETLPLGPLTDGLCDAVAARLAAIIAATQPLLTAAGANRAGPRVDHEHRRGRRAAIGGRHLTERRASPYERFRAFAIARS
jgi:hypothetical protein